MSSSFLRRHRRKLLAAAALGAAGAAAAYWWWYSEEDLEQQQQQAAAGVSPFSNSAPAAAAAGRQGRQPNGTRTAAAAADAEEQQQEEDEFDEDAAASLDASLARHFNSISELSDRQALEELLPRLHQTLNSLTDLAPLKQQLRGGPPGADALTADQKLALWRGLASHSFTRALGAVWLVPLLDLLVRLKLHIVGRHMYLESKLPQLQPRGSAAAGAGGFGSSGGGALAGLRPPAACGPFGGPLGRMALPPCLSDRAKEEFFRCDFFIATGALGLLAKLRAAVEASLAEVDFGASMSCQDVEALVRSMHERFEGSFLRGQDLWADYLAAPGPAPVSVRTASGMEALLSPVEAAMVDELNGELRATLGDYRFVEALRAAVRHTSKTMGAYISTKMAGSGGSSGSSNVADEQQQPQQPQQQQQQQQFPWIVTHVSKSGQLLFEATDRCTKGFSSLREVHALCASVFTFAPNIY